MPRPQRPWFRFYVEAMHDPKLRQLSPTHRWLWVSVLAAARQSPIPGFLMVSDRQAMSESMLSDFAAVRVSDVRSGLTAMESIGLIERDPSLDCWAVPRFSDRQFESDDITARTRKHRSKEQGRNVPRTAVGTPPETETETESEMNPLTPTSGGMNPRARGTNPRAIAAKAAEVDARAQYENGLRVWAQNRSNYEDEAFEDAAKATFIDFSDLSVVLKERGL